MFLKDILKRSDYIGGFSLALFTEKPNTSKIFAFSKQNPILSHSESLHSKNKGMSVFGF